VSSISLVYRFALFFISACLRHEAPDTPITGALIFSFLGAGLGAVTAWLGGELVERMGVGVADGAHLDSPSSLSRKPAKFHLNLKAKWVS
jgi:hypothetical protein